MSVSEQEKKFYEAYNAKNYAEARQAAQEILASSMRGKMLMAKVSYAEGKEIQAQNEIEEYLRIFPEDKEALYDAGLYNDKMSGERALEYFERSARKGYEPAKEILPIQLFSVGIDRWNRAGDNDFNAQADALDTLRKSIKTAMECIRNNPRYEYGYLVMRCFSEMYDIAEAGLTTVYNVRVDTVDSSGRVTGTERYETRNYYGSGNIWEMRSEMQQQKKDAKAAAQAVARNALEIANAMDSFGDRSDAAMLRLAMMKKEGKHRGVEGRWFENYATAMGKQERGDKYKEWMDTYTEFGVYGPPRPNTEVLLKVRETGVKPLLASWYLDKSLVPEDADAYMDVPSEEEVAQFHAEEQAAEDKRIAKKEKNDRTPTPRKVFISIADFVPIKVLPTIAAAALHFFLVEPDSSVLLGGFSFVSLLLTLVGIAITVVGVRFFQKKEQESRRGWIISEYIGQLLMWYLMALNILFGLIVMGVIWLIFRNKF